ncbi:MAG: glycosyltransferase [bacterium]
MNQESKTNKIVILTGLPFRKQGNQSLMRFVKMLLKHSIDITMFSAGSDTRGEKVIDSELFHLYKITSLEIEFTNFLNKVVLKISKKRVKSRNYFEQIKSEDVIPPYGSYSIGNMVNKWVKFLFYLFDNVALFFNILFFQSGRVKMACVIVGYEAGYTPCGRWIAKIFRKKYINKYQGTILVATNRNKSLALKYFPQNYFSINKADLCLMVQDGTDGKYYAEQKRNRNIFNEPHGVLEYEIPAKYGNVLDKLKDKGKFILFNNASGSTWKRVDRVVRGMMKLDKNILNKVVLLTTYHAANVDDLKEYVKKNSLQDNVIFLEGVDNTESNYLLQNSDVVVMTNDFSNLGNPILEAIYYKVPLISIDDGSLDGFVTNGKDALLISLDEKFDENMAKAIERYYKDKSFYNKVRKTLNKSGAVRDLQTQQLREFKVIEKILNEC